MPAKKKHKHKRKRESGTNGLLQETPDSTADSGHPKEKHRKVAESGDKTSKDTKDKDKGRKKKKKKKRVKEKEEDTQS